MKTAMVFVSGVIMLVIAAPAFSSQGGNVDLEVILDRGGVLESIPHDEHRTGNTHVFKSYLEARKGENYAILIRNRLPERIAAVIAVDGRNVITGKKSFLKNGETMYIVEPYGQARIEGWRTSDDTVNRFYFTGSADSYSARTFSDTSAMGVIAVAVFREKDRPSMLYEQERSSGRTTGVPAAPRSEARKAEKDAAGTGFGREHHSPVVKVKFEPESLPVEKILVKYEWRDELCRKGIIRCRHEARNRLWDNDEYAPYPPGYSYR